MIRQFFFSCILIVICSGIATSQDASLPLRSTHSSAGFVFITPDSRANPIDTVAGAAITFTLTAKDSAGNVIPSWHVIGSAITLTIHNSSANSDSSFLSWNSDPVGFTFSTLSMSGATIPKPKKLNDSTWEIAPVSFLAGQLQLSFTDTKAERDVFLTIEPQKNAAAQSSPKMHFRPAAISNYLVEITSQTSLPNQVFQMRMYELFVTPRDRYLNYSNETIATNFSARFPTEFDNTSVPKGNIFGGAVMISGQMNGFCLSTKKREKPLDQLQTITATARWNTTINGISDPYEILTHAPRPFRLKSPRDSSIVLLIRADSIETFSWEKSVDPFTNIRVSKLDPPSKLLSDKVAYMFKIFDQNMQAFKAFVADAAGVMERLTLNHGQLFGIINDLSGNPTTKTIDAIWLVEATDGLFTTVSEPSLGHFIRITKKPTSTKSLTDQESFSLHQNYPNPIGTPSLYTRIGFSLDRPAHVSLKVYDLLGKEVATVTNDFYSDGEQSVVFNATNLQSGNYFYKLFANGKVLTRQMTVMR